MAGLELTRHIVIQALPITIGTKKISLYDYTSKLRRVYFRIVIKL